MVSISFILPDDESAQDMVLGNIPLTSFHSTGKNLKQAEPSEAK
jgi:hypothetical protein